MNYIDVINEVHEQYLPTTPRAVIGQFWMTIFINGGILMNRKSEQNIKVEVGAT
jgi:hypothetical protein